MNAELVLKWLESLKERDQITAFKVIHCYDKMHVTVQLKCPLDHIDIRFTVAEEK